MDQTLQALINRLTGADFTADQRAAVSELVETLRLQQKQIKALEEKITHPQHEEQLSVLTRPEFNREVARMLAFNERYGGVTSVLYFNFDNLGQITNQFGKAITNAIVREVSNTLMRHVRGSDIVGRLAADEFGVLLTQCGNADAWKKGEQLSTSLYNSTSEIQGVRTGINVTYGAYTFRENEDISTGLKQAAQTVTRTSQQKVATQ